MMAYKTYEQAETELMQSGYVKYQCCINGETLFLKESKVDPFYGGYSKPAICRIRFNAVAPIWGDNKNFYTIDFL